MTSLPESSRRSSRSTPDVDGQNLARASSAGAVDRANALFYGRFPYPWRPATVDRVLDPDASRAMLCQALGDWTHQVVPPCPRIWVAGCGTNQAALTALAFPDATVVGSDVSGPSLDLCRRTMAEVGIHNLELKQESLNEVSYDREFDYVICTGVIHHNADPGATLTRIAAALKPNGILELMVYNRFHCIQTAAFQKAMHLLRKGEDPDDHNAALNVALSVIEHFPIRCAMSHYLESYRRASAEVFADSLMQPVEYSYTVHSLNALAASCGLELYLPVVSPFDRGEDRLTWRLPFADEGLDARCRALDDVDRWQLINLLLGERSPMLWFYFRRANASPRRTSETEICDAFLNTRFRAIVTPRQRYMLTADGRYAPLAAAASQPGRRPAGGVATAALQSVVTSADGTDPMRMLLERHGCPTAAPDVNEIRIKLTTPAFPFLQAV